MAENYLLLDSTGQSIKTTLTNIHTALTTQNAKLDTQNANIAAWAGTLSSLTTGDKSSLVAAINWVLAQHTTHTNTSAMHDVYAYLDSVSNAENGAGIHNSLYRGISLGNTLTTDMCARIADGTFKGLWCGDYLEKSISFIYKNCQNSDADTTASGTWRERFASHNYWKRAGDSVLTRNHSMMIADTAFFSAWMNSTSITTGGYLGSEMFTKYLPGALNAVKAFFGADHILTYRNTACNAVTDGRAMGHTWYSSQIDLLTESMVYGSPQFRAMNTGTTDNHMFQIGCKQVNLFRHRPDLISNRVWYWLQDVVSPSLFANVNDYGYSNRHSAASVDGVRPACLIC